MAMEATPLVPAEGAARLRSRFLPLPIDDPRLLSHLRLVTVRLRATDPELEVDDLVRSYARQNGACALCRQPTTLDPLPAHPNQPTDPKDRDGGGNWVVCGDWCVDATRLRPHLIAHTLCVEQTSEKKQSIEKEQKGDRDPRQRYTAERRWLEALQRQMLPKTAGADGGADERGEAGASGDAGLDEGAGVVGALLERYVRMAAGIGSIVRRANEPPYAEASRWLDADKTRLEKRCHKTQCCGKWSPASDFPLRRPFKPGQIDSCDFFSCFCPRRTQKKNIHEQKTSYPDEKLMVGMVASQNTQVAEVRVGGAGAVATMRKDVAEATYVMQRRLLPLYVASDTLRAVLPQPPTLPDAHELQWNNQSGECGVCKERLELWELLHWDICNGRWVWMHSRCNPNAWAIYLPGAMLSGPSDDQQVYAERHATDKVFDQTIKAALGAPANTLILMELLEAMRERLINLSEQAFIQTRFGLAAALRTELLNWVGELRTADPEAADRLLQQINQIPHRPPKPPKPPPHALRAKRKRRT